LTSVSIEADPWDNEGEPPIARRSTVVPLFPAPARLEERPALREPPALARLYRTHWSELCVYVRRRFGAGPPEPEDIAQAAFVRLSARGDLEGLENPRAFLYRVVHNLAIEERRRARTRTRIEADYLPIGEEETDDRDPERVSIGKDRRRLLEIAFASLEPRTRQILIMSRQDDLSSAEIARRLGLSPTHVKRLIADGIAHCRAFVEQPDEGDGCGM
jgi:RNA polymerase sigma factor (sigma-70 family)